MKLLTKTKLVEVGMIVDGFNPTKLVETALNESTNMGRHGHIYSCQSGLQGCGWCQLVGL